MSNKPPRRLKPSDKESASVTTSLTNQANMELTEQFDHKEGARHRFGSSQLDSEWSKIPVRISRRTDQWNWSYSWPEAEAKVNTVQTENAWLKEKVDDLENHSHRLNRIVGIPEGVEGSNPVVFMTQFFKEIFGEDFFPTPLLPVHAHRLRPARSQKADGNQRPRVFIVAFHNFQDKQRIIVQRHQREMDFRGNKVFLHKDEWCICPPPSAV